MAEGKKDAKAEEERGPTMRLVLRRVAVLELPEGITTEQIIAAHKALGGKGAPREGAAWVEVGEFEGASKEHAIEAHAGKPGTAEAKVGTFKAPTVKAWAGGLRFSAPPKPLVEKETID